MGVPLLRAALAAVLLAGCASGGGTAGSGAAEGGRHPWTVPHVLRYATGEDVAGLNPHLYAQVTASLMNSNTMAWLVKYDHNNRPVPELATVVPTQANGGVSRDGKTITYHLRRNAKWSDGVPFTAEDVAFSIATVRNPANNELTHSGFEYITAVRTPDPYTVVIRLNRPYSGFYVNFFSSAGGNPCVLPKHILGGLKTINDAPYNTLPIGIGPFKYASWKRADNITLVPDPLYFGRKPKLQKVIFKIIPDRNTVLTQLSTHEIDLWLPVPAAYSDRISTLGDVKVLKQSSYLYNHFDFELEHPVVGDLAVRQALRLAMDRATILQKIRHGVGILQETPFGPGNPLAIDVPRIPFDLQAANDTLERAGWKRGPDGVRVKNGRRLEFTIAIGTGLPDTDAIVEQLRLSWGRIGARFEVKHYPSPLYFGAYAAGGILYAGKFDVAFYAWLTSPNGDLSNILGCDRFPPKGQNVPRWCDRAADAAMRRQLATYDPKAQLAASRIVQESIVRDVPTIVTDVREDLFAYNDDLKNFHPNQVTPFDNLVDLDI
ncbi:MAG TPA: peptide ABC transporter substrate-binding protein [Candidatus Elarobacter sp.]